MADGREKHALATLPGAFAFALWAVYALHTGINFDAALASVVIGAACGLLACVLVAANFRYWRAAVVGASVVYLLLYLIRIVRMTALSGEMPPFQALSFYYSMSWNVAAGAFQERGLGGGLAHAYLEFVMPVLVIVAAGAVLVAARRKAGAAPRA